MIVQGGKTLLGQQGAQKKMRPEKNDQNNFQDLLVGAKKKKAPIQKPGKKTYGIKKKTDQDGFDENQPISKSKDMPKKKEIGPTMKQKTLETAVKQSGLPQQVNKSQQAENSQGTVVSAMDQKKLDGDLKAQKTADSLNLSDPENKSLENNKKMMKSLENSFEEMMAKIKTEAATKEGAQGFGQELNKGIGQDLQNKLGGLSKVKGGQLKIGADMDTSETGQTLSIQNGEDLAGTRTLSKEGGDSHHESGTRDLNVLMGQQIEQDSQVGEIEGVQFGEELEMRQSGKAEKIENMQSIVKQARAFVDDGGGTMEIHLQPEGLGKVQLKVAVQNGQVNVEMLADNLNAKKALEEGLLDIKTALEGQKLLVETLKVEMSQDYQKDFSDLSNHMQEQANKDFAEQFLGQFKQEREERFGGMFDSFKNFQPNRSESELSLNRNPYAENGKGRSINLVA